VGQLEQANWEHGIKHIGNIELSKLGLADQEQNLFLFRRQRTAFLGSFSSFFHRLCVPPRRIINMATTTTIPTAQDMTLSETTQLPRRVRRDCLLSVGERNAIQPFKSRYKNEARREVRVALVKSEILAAYFNYLHSRDEDPKTPEELKAKTKV
jgi:hypothetical protein